LIAAENMPVMIISMAHKSEAPKRNNTAKKKAKRNSKTEQLVPYQFKPGEVHNPAGRPKGSRNKFAEAFIKDFLADWEMAGASAIQVCRLEDPAAYLRVAASLIPKELNIKEGDSQLDALLEQLNDDQLADVIAALATIGIAAKGEKGKAKAITGS